MSGTHLATPYSGSANLESPPGGVDNLTLDSFVTDAGLGTGSTATSAVHLTTLPGLSVTQAYGPSTNAPGVLFEDKVTITNSTGSDIDDLRYVRVMDWDVPTTEFYELVTILGTGTTTLLEMSHDDGFASADPLDFPNFGIIEAPLTDFVDSGPWDHGAYFRFNFGTLANGDSYEFSVFYGFAPSEAAALAAVTAEGIELVSFGQPNPTDWLGSPIPIDELGNTYIFGFKGVGGEPIPPVPEPATMLLLGSGLVGLAATRKKLSKK